MTGDMSAAQLALALLAVGDVRNLAYLSALDEATAAYGALSPEIREASRAFSEARMACWHPSDTAWELAAKRAGELAAELAPLGDYVLPRCQERAGYGTCGTPLSEDGTCRHAAGHLSEEG